MKAIVYTKYGAPEVLQLKEVPKPTPKDNEVLIKLYATTVNRSDCGFRKPEYPVIIRLVNGIFKPKINILGSEFAGEVEAIGAAVKSFKKGDQVFGLSSTKFGCHAQYICVPEDSAIALKPINTSYQEAAAVCDGLMLANNYLRKIDYSTPQKILIYGASGSIGTASVQLAKYYGAEVTAVCNTKGVEMVKSIGADEVIDYTKTNFTNTEKRFNIVLDAVGKSSFFECKKILKPGGVYFSTELGFMAQNVFLALLTPIWRGKKVKFPIPSAGKDDILFFKKIIEEGKYKAVIDRSYPLEDIVEATKYVETHQKIGNVAIIVSH